MAQYFDFLVSPPSKPDVSNIGIQRDCALAVECLVFNTERLPEEVYMAGTYEFCDQFGVKLCDASWQTSSSVNPSQLSLALFLIGNDPDRSLVISFKLYKVY